MKATAKTEYTLMVTQCRIEGEPVTQYGVRWKTAMGKGSLPNLTENKQKALIFLGRLQQEQPEPIHLKDLAEDFLEECYGRCLTLSRKTQIAGHISFEAGPR